MIPVRRRLLTILRAKSLTCPELAVLSRPLEYERFLRTGDTRTEGCYRGTHYKYVHRLLDDMMRHAYVHRFKESKRYRYELTEYGRRSSDKLVRRGLHIG